MLNTIDRIVGSFSVKQTNVWTDWPFLFLAILDSARRLTQC